MNENEVLQMAKEAYVLSEQLKELESSIVKSGDKTTGYPSYARNFNAILNRARAILKIDTVLIYSIKHLSEYDERKERGYRKDFEGLKADIPVLKATLSSFFQFYFPTKEKEKMGFI